MDIPRQWRLQDQRYRLIGSACRSCGTKSFPPRPVCPECGAREAEPYRFSGLGEVYSYSTVYQAPDGFEEYVPYTVALVRLDEGPLITAQLTDLEPDEVEIGMKVEMVTRKLQEYNEDGLIVYGYKFRPLMG
ncbi:MAG: Zn-ribbon domain-containing OB-fold protein [Anaerolineae bacterium]